MLYQDQITMPNPAFWLMVIAIITVGQSKIIQVPPAQPEETLYLRLEQLLALEHSFDTFGTLSRVQKKQVYQLQEGKQAPFNPCYEQPPSSIFFPQYQHKIRENVRQNGLVYNFEDLQFPNNLIDIALYRHRIYYTIGNGTIYADFIANNFSSIKKGQQYSLKGQDKVAKGYFVVLPDAVQGKGVVLFVNGQGMAAMSLGGDNFEEVVSEAGPGSFESAIPLQGNYFAVAYGSGGIRVYSINSKREVKIERELNSTSQGLKKCDIVDIAYDFNRKTLFVLNRQTGVLSLQLTFGSQLDMEVTSSVISSPDCDVIYYDSSQEELYLSCYELHKYRISKWPVIDQKVLPKQDIAIRQITATEDVVALVGRNIFEIIAAGRRTSIFRDKLLDKLILTNSGFISANQNSILIGSYQIHPPQLFCSTRNSSHLGTHRLVLKATASCNPQFFDQIGFRPGSLEPEDKCVYTVYQNMEVWEAAEIDTKPFFIFALLIGLLGLVIIIWWGCSHLSLRKLRNFVDNYRELEEEGVGTEPDQRKRDKQKDEEPSGEANKYHPHVQEAQIPDAGLHDIQ